MPEAREGRVSPARFDPLREPVKRIKKLDGRSNSGQNVPAARQAWNCVPVDAALIDGIESDLPSGRRYGFAFDGAAVISDRASWMASGSMYRNPLSVDAGSDFQRLSSLGSIERKQDRYGLGIVKGHPVGRPKFRINSSLTFPTVICCARAMVTGTTVAGAS